MNVLFRSDALSVAADSWRFVAAKNAVAQLSSAQAALVFSGWYGMKFQHMPELRWPWGYPLALALILASSIVPY